VNKPRKSTRTSEDSRNSENSVNFLKKKNKDFEFVLGRSDENSEDAKTLTNDLDPECHPRTPSPPKDSLHESTPTRFREFKEVTILDHEMIRRAILETVSKNYFWGRGAARRMQASATVRQTMFRNNNTN
jgi:hypothetical protein